MARKKWGFGTHKKSDPEIIKPAENVVQETQTSCLTADGIDLEKLPTAKEDEPLYKVKVKHSSLRKREAPNTNAKIIGFITDLGIYDIFDERDGWGQLKDFSWIMLEFTQRI